MKKAIYAISADPITYGHIDIIKRATAIFDHLIVAIGNNPLKSYTFSQDKRTSLAQNALEHISRVEVIQFQGMLTDYAYINGIDTVIRGVRNPDDFNYELVLHQISQSQKLGIETIFIPASSSHIHISSGAVKAIQLEQGLIHEYVPLNIKEALEDKISGQKLIGVTGMIGAGKSHYCKDQVAALKQAGKAAHHIDIDVISQRLIEGDFDNEFIDYKKHIIERMGNSVLDNNGRLSKTKIGQIVFKDADKLKELNQITLKPILTLLRKELYGKKGTIFIESALMAEMNMMHICNNNITLVDVSQQTIMTRLKKRGLTDEQIQRRINSQFGFALKKEIIENKIKYTGHGDLSIVSKRITTFEVERELYFNK